MTLTSEATNDLYAGFSAEVRQELATQEQLIAAPQGTELLCCGKCPDHLIILSSGSAEISVLASDKTLSLGVARAGRVFGLHSLISGVPPDTTVTCLEECKVTLVPKHAFLDLLQRYPQMYIAVVKVLSSDLAAADRVIRTHARGPAGRAHLRYHKHG